MTTGLALKVEDVSLVYGAYGGGISVVSINITVEMINHALHLIQFEVTTTRISSPPSGQLVNTINNVPSVRDLNWVEGSDYITVTTDDEVIHHNTFL